MSAVGTKPTKTSLSDYSRFCALSGSYFYEIKISDFGVQL
jgi:hypothetical protein